MVSDPLRELARRQAARRALVDRSAGFWVSWFDLDGLAHAWARRLEAAGVGPGDRVAASEPAGVRFSALLHGCLRLGAALVPISPRAPDAEVKRILRDSTPRLFVRDGEVEALAGAVRGAEGDACVIYTSGTTGEAKGVRLTLVNQVASARGCAASLDATERDRWLLVLSPHHVAGLSIFMRSVICAQPLVNLARFEEAAVLEALEVEQPTLVSLVPTMVARLLAAGGLQALQRPRAILVGGAAATAEPVTEWAELGLNVCPSYGLTETCSQVATVPPGRALELAGTAGLVGPHAFIEMVEGGIGGAGPPVSSRSFQPAPRPSRLHRDSGGRDRGRGPHGLSRLCQPGAAARSCGRPLCDRRSRPAGRWGADRARAARRRHLDRRGQGPAGGGGARPPRAPFGAGRGRGRPRRSHLGADRRGLGGG